MRLPGWRYEQIKKTVISLFEKVSRIDIPINPVVIAKVLSVDLKPYSNIPKKTQVHFMHLSNDGCAMQAYNNSTNYPQDKWIIAYNDTQPTNRIRFTIMHELGHIALDHTEHSELAENEANFFAGYALAPPPLIQLVQFEDYIDIANIFQISHECARCAMSRYYSWLQYGERRLTDYEVRLRKLFQKAS